MASSPTSRSRQIKIQISASLNGQLSLAARRSGITKSAFIRVALEREFNHDRQLARECALKCLTPEPESAERISQPQLFKMEDSPGIS